MIEVQSMLKALGRCTVSVEPDEFLSFTVGIFVTNANNYPSWHYVYSRSLEDALCQAMVLRGACMALSGRETIEDLLDETDFTGEPTNMKTVKQEALQKAAQKEAAQRKERKR